MASGGHIQQVIHHIGTGSNPAEVKALVRQANLWIDAKDPQASLFKLFHSQNGDDSAQANQHDSLSVMNVNEWVNVGTAPRLLYQVLKLNLSLLGFDQMLDTAIVDLIVMRLIEPCSKYRSLLLLSSIFHHSYSFRNVSRMLKKLGTPLTAITSDILKSRDKPDESVAASKSHLETKSLQAPMAAPATELPLTLFAPISVATLTTPTELRAASSTIPLSKPNAHSYTIIDLPQEGQPSSTFLSETIETPTSGGAPLGDTPTSKETSLSEEIPNLSAPIPTAKVPLSDQPPQLFKLSPPLWIKMESLAVKYAKKYLSFDFTLVFYDVTTLYFESFASDEELKRCGFSKDHKNNQPQLVLGLLVTKEGFPISLQVFPGNTFEGHTFIPVIKRLMADHKIKAKDLTIVADAAMISTQIVTALNTMDLKYIVGARIHSLNEKITNTITSCLSAQIDGQTMRVDDPGKGILVCSFSIERYRKDKLDTKKQVKRAQDQITKGRAISHLKFISVNKDLKQISLNTKLIADTKRLWGIKGYYTNQITLTDQEIINHYRNLWRIEQSFRIAKTDLQIRPLYHHQTATIKAHLMICFMALCLARHLEYKTKLPIKRIIDQLKTVSDVTLRNTITNDIVVIKGEIDSVSQQIVDLTHC
jgi:hypothetical protein